MSAWKSPLLYLGFVVILMAAAALFAPMFVDWGTYRAEFEDYGRKLTGREVTIAGPIEARLFPWPVLVLNRVSIANPEGAQMPELMDARRIEMRMAMAPLISGQVEVNSISVDAPVIAFERLATGMGTWSIEPERRLAGLLRSDRIAVAEIAIRNGTVYLGDHRRGGLARIDAFDATLSAPSLSGPWRLRGTASRAGSRFEIGLSTGRIRSGQATKVGLRLAPGEGSGLAYSFDGEVNRPGGHSIEGALKIAPAVSATGKADAAVGLRPFAVKAEIEADFDTVTVRNIEAAPAFSVDAGNFITGEARIDLGNRIGVQASLSTARLDLDQIAGRHARDLLRTPAGPELLAALLGGVPDGLDLQLDMAATSLIAGGETLDATRLKLRLSPERLRIDEFTVALPGQTQGRLTGTVVLGDGEPLMSGDVALESVSLRDFVLWALPEQRRAIEDVWNGARGRLKLAARLDLTPQRVRVSEVDATLDDIHLNGSFAMQGGPEPGLAVRFDADQIDLDRYLPRGLPRLAGRGGLAATLVDAVGDSMRAGDVQLTAQTGRLLFHGVEARDIAIDIGANENGIELRTVEIGQVGAARLDVAGLVRFPDGGIAGSINALIDADDPRGLLRLFGAFGPGEPEPAWAKAMGPLDLRLVADASAHDGITTAAMALTGQVGQANADVEATFKGERSNWQQGEVDLSATLAARSSAMLAAMIGHDLPQADSLPMRVDASVSGSLRQGLATSVETDLLGSRTQFAGTIGEDRNGITAKGRVALLAERAGELLAALGLPRQEFSPLAEVLAGESALSYDSTGLKLTGLGGTAGGAAFNGDLKLVFDPVRRLSGHIETGRLSLPWTLGAVLLAHDGTPKDLSSRFNTAFPDLEAVITVAAERLEMMPNLVLEASQLDVKLTPLELMLKGRGSGPTGAPVAGDLAVRLDSRGAAIEGAVEGGLDFGALLQASDGSPVLDADGQIQLSFSGNGRSPAGVLSSLQAEGSYDVPRGVLKHIDPNAFARDLAAVKELAEIDRLIAQSLRGGDLAFSGGKGKLALTNGVLTAHPLSIKGDGVAGEMRFFMEAASGEIDLSLVLAMAEPDGMPSFELAYAGPPRALETSTDAKALKSHLVMKLLNESVDQLEELQREERRLVEEEKRFWSEQAKREAERKGREIAEQRAIAEREAAAAFARARAAAAAAGDDEAGEPDESETVPPRSIPDAADSPDAVLVMPLNAPASGQTEPPGRRDEPEPEAAVEPERIQLPRDGNLGRIPDPVFSGPIILQPNLNDRPRPVDHR